MSLFLTSSTFLTNLNKGTGSVIGLAGALVVSPEGTRWFVRRAKVAALFWRRPDPVTGHATIKLPGFTLRAEGHAVRSWPDDESVEEKLERLHEWLILVEGETRRVAVDLRDHKDDTTKRIAELKRTHDADVGTLRSMIEAMEKDDARINGRALPVIGLGIFLSGIPEWLAAVPVLAWAAFLVAAVATVAVGRSVVLDEIRLRRT